MFWWVVAIVLMLILVVALLLTQGSHSKMGGQDGIVYRVSTRLTPAQQRESARMLAALNSRIMRLINHLHEKYQLSDDHREPLEMSASPRGPDAERMRPLREQVRRLLQLYQPDRLEESLPSPRSAATSFTVGKGERMAICMRDKRTHLMYDIDTLMFVTVHELAHVACPESGLADPHTERFWEIFRFLLLECEEIQLFNIRDYTRNPVDYAGIRIHYSPIHDSVGRIRHMVGKAAEDPSAPPWRRGGGHRRARERFCTGH